VRFSSARIRLLRSATTWPGRITFCRRAAARAFSRRWEATISSSARASSTPAKRDSRRWRRESFTWRDWKVSMITRVRSRHASGRRLAMARTAEVYRKTRETDIGVELNLDGNGASEIQTGIPFFNHMLESFARHGLFDLKVRAKGDIE